MAYRACLFLVVGLAACGGDVASSHGGSSGESSSSSAGPPSSAASSSASNGLGGATSSSSGGASSSTDEGELSCTLGGRCMLAQACMGVLHGCENRQCECLDGRWQAPCPDGGPTNGAACSIPGAYCGVVTETYPCGAEDCYCMDGGWRCGPTCIVADAGSAD